MRDETPRRPKMKRHASFLLAATLAAGLPATELAATPATPAPAASTIAVKLADARAAQRDLWIGHVFWVRNVVDSTFEGDAAAVKAAEGQVVVNAKAIAGSIEPF